MKDQLFYTMKTTRFALCILLAGIFLVAGCATPNPVKGWKSWNANLQPPNEHHPNEPYYQIDKAIIDDYQAYIKKIQPKNQDLYIDEVDFYEDGTGQHAVRFVIETGLREYAEYYLMYNKSNVRTKVIKGGTWHQFHI
jgi:hypothetical protein